MIVVFNTFWTAMEVYSTEEDYEDNTQFIVLVFSCVTIKKHKMSPVSSFKL